MAIKSGTAKLLANDEKENVHILNALLPSELSGFDGLYQINNNSSAIALKRMSYCEFPVDQFETLCLKIPAFARKLFKHSSEILNESQNQLVASKCSAEEKLAMLLISSDHLISRNLV